MSEKISHHDSAATGAATTSATAKLRARTRTRGARDGTSFDESGRCGCQGEVIRITVSDMPVIAPPLPYRRAEGKARIRSIKDQRSTQGNRGRKTAGSLSALVAAGAFSQAILALPAQAQERPVDVPETVTENLDPKGIPLGSFVLYPRWNEDLRYDTNVYNRPVAQDDLLLVLRPTARLASNFGRHAVQLDVSGEARRYAYNEGENSEQWAVRGQGRLDLANRFVISGYAGIADRIERRGTLGDEFVTDKPVSFREIIGGASVAREGGVLEWKVSADSRRSAFDNSTSGGLPVDQSYRDARRDSVSYRLDYHRFPRLGLTARVTGTRLRYDDFKDRNSSGFSILGGITYEATDLIDVEAVVGYVQHSAGATGQPGIKAFDYALTAKWTPTPRSSFRLSGARSVERAPQVQLATVLQSTLDASATYAVATRTLLSLDAGIERDDFRGIDRKDTRYFAEASVRQLVTPQLAAVFGVGARKQSSSGLGGRDYSGATVRAGISLVL
ncbi:MAG: hypothetical protein RLZZ08_121 [Pseudomonadota bacterium]|jgi:hypothetical protein